MRRPPARPHVPGQRAVAVAIAGVSVLGSVLGWTQEVLHPLTHRVAPGLTGRLVRHWGNDGLRCIFTARAITAGDRGMRWTQH